MNEIVVGVDGSESAEKAARQAAELANAFGRPLHIVRAVSRVSVESVGAGSGEAWQVSSTRSADDFLQAMAGALGARTPVTTAVVHGDPAAALCDEARRLDASVIVVGNKRTQGASRLLGSIASAVVRSAPCDIHIVHTY